MINFLVKNYQWIIGAIAVPFIIYFLQKRRKEIINFFKMKQEGGKNSTFYQAKKIIVKQTGLTVPDVKEIALSVFKENFPVLQRQAMITAQENVRLFIGELISEINERLSKEEINRFRDPDIQYVLNDAMKSTARKNSETLRKNLSILIVERVKNDNKDLKRIVYNEAIATIRKLTTNQLKILTLCFLLRYAYYTGIINWETFNNYLNTRIKPFLDFKDTNAEFQHIEYTGCGSIDIGSWNLMEIFRSTYSFLFRFPIKKSEIDNLNLPDFIRKEILGWDQSKDGYFIQFRNRNDLEKYLEEKNINEELKNKLLHIYNSHIKNTSEIKKQIIEKTDLGQKIIKIWENKNLAHLSLTSVGIVIAATYYEQIIREKINIDIWIN